MRTNTFKADSRRVTIWSKHGTKRSEAILHPRPHNNRALVNKMGCNRNQKKPLKSRCTAPHVLIAEALRGYLALDVAQSSS